MIFNLIKETQTQDEIGQWIQTPVKRQVYGQITSVSADEFFAAGQNGIRAEFRIVMFGPDYEGEENAEINGVVYSVYRVYRGRTDAVELYLERRAGDVDET